MSWVLRSKAAFTHVHTKVVEVGEVLPCVLNRVVGGVARVPSWEIVVVAEAGIRSYLTADKKIMRQSKTVQQIHFSEPQLLLAPALPPFDKFLEIPLTTK